MGCWHVPGITSGFPFLGVSAPKLGWKFSLLPFQILQYVTGVGGAGLHTGCGQSSWVTHSLCSWELARRSVPVLLGSCMLWCGGCRLPWKGQNRACFQPKQKGGSLLPSLAWLVPAALNTCGSQAWWEPSLTEGRVETSLFKMLLQ